MEGGIMELLYRDEVYAIVGAGMEVNRELNGSGFYEGVYQEALEIELGLRSIPFEPQKELPIAYKGKLLKKRYIADVVCFGNVIVELKCAKCLTTQDEAQVLNYLKATGLRVALLLNFGAASGLEWKRLVR
jgi:GxxExxY protein